MAKMKGLEALSEHIVGLSSADEFETAKHEWRVSHVVMLDYPDDHCPCGQLIKELCYIHNDATDEETYVGNVCVKRFMGIDTGNLFSGLKRIIDNNRATPNFDVIDYADEHGFLYGKEYSFLISIRGKRALSEKQSGWLRKINRRIVERITVTRKDSSV